MKTKYRMKKWRRRRLDFANLSELFELPNIEDPQFWEGKIMDETEKWKTRSIKLSPWCCLRLPKNRSPPPDMRS